MRLYSYGITAIRSARFRFLNGDTINEFNCSTVDYSTYAPVLTGNYTYSIPMLTAEQRQQDYTGGGIRDYTRA